jgi:hypothetical protein
VAVGVTGQVENVPAVDFVARSEQFGFGHEVHQPRECAGLGFESLHIRLGCAVDAQVLRHPVGHPRLAPSSDALVIVVGALVHRRPGQLGNVGGCSDMVGVEVRNHDAPNRAGELAQIARPLVTRVR